MSFGFMFLRELPSEKVEIAYVFRHPTSLFYTNMSSWKDLIGFTYGRNEVSPDSEQIELTMPARHNSETLWAWSKSKTNYLIQDLSTVKLEYVTVKNPSTYRRGGATFNSTTAKQSQELNNLTIKIISSKTNKR